MMFGVGMMGQVGGVGIAPPPTTAMEAWFRKNVGITSAANAVSNWANQAASGAARDYVQATGAAQPTLQGDGTILFDGTSDYLQTAAFTLGQPYTRYIRFKQITWTSGDYTLTAERQTLRLCSKAGHRPTSPFSPALLR